MYLVLSEFWRPFLCTWLKFLVSDYLLGRGPVSPDTHLNVFFSPTILRRERWNQRTLIQNYWTPTWLCRRSPGQFVQIFRHLVGCVRILHRIVFGLLSWPNSHLKFAYFFLDICPGGKSQKLAKYVICTVPIVALHRGLRQPDADVPSHLVLEVFFSYVNHGDNTLVGKENGVLPSWFWMQYLARY